MAQSPREASIVAAILKKIRRPGSVWAMKIHGGPCQMVGVPDILGVFDGGRLFALEVKRRGCKPTPIQLTVMRQLQACGALVAVVHSVAEAEEALASSRDASVRGSTADGGEAPPDEENGAEIRSTALERLIVAVNKNSPGAPGAVPRAEGRGSTADAGDAPPDEESRAVPRAEGRGSTASVSPPSREWRSIAPGAVPRAEERGSTADAGIPGSTAPAEILPCPFCGEAPQVKIWGRQYFKIACRAGHAEVSRPDREEALAAWNRRK